MARVVFELTTPVAELAKTVHPIGRVVTVTGHFVTITQQKPRCLCNADTVFAVT
jgi:hypothetical protein